MTFGQYAAHYFAMPGFLLFFAVTLGAVLLNHCILLWRAGAVARQYVDEDQADALRMHFDHLTDQYYELVFSAASILFFSGLYFLIDWNYFHLSGAVLDFWQKYGDFLLLAFLVVSMLGVDLLDHLFVPVRHLKDGERGTLRLAGLLYMMILFLYIKFIYEDNNYDTIILYFLTMIIGRFVYFDASFADFRRAMKELGRALPILLLVLLSTVISAAYGFGTGYLLRSNGVVVSLWIAHIFLILEIVVISRAGLMRRAADRAARRLEAPELTEAPDGRPRHERPGRNAYRDAHRK